MKQRHTNIIIATTFIWIGFVCAISFMEAWLKFQAPGISLPLGLGIGQLIFSALNKIEILSSIIIILFLNHKKIAYKQYYYFGIALAILILQTVWLLPLLNERASHIIAGMPLPQSNLHVFFVLLEVIKVVCLFIFGIKSFNNSMRRTNNSVENSYSVSKPKTYESK